MKQIHLDTSRLLGIRLVDLDTGGEIQGSSYYASKISAKPGVKTIGSQSGNIYSGLNSKIGGKIGNGTKIGGKIGGKLGRKP